MMKKQKMLICFALLFALAGCTRQIQTETTAQQHNQSAQTATQNQPQQTPQVPVQEGGTLYLCMRSALTLNPILNEDDSVDAILKLIYMPLIKLDQNHKPTPSIAQSWSFDETGTVLSMNLRSDITWQNGTNLTADDVIFSLQALDRAGENVVYKDCMKYISNYRKTGTYSVEITFHQNFSGNLYALQMPIVSRQYYGSENLEQSPNDMIPMGNGYFAFEKYVPAKEMVLNKCNSSFGTMAHIDKIVVTISTDEDTDLYSFEQGLTDLLVVSSSDMGKSDNENSTKYYEYTTNYFDFVGFNFTKSLFQDSNVRKAIASSLPKESILENVYLSRGSVTESFVNPQYWFYEANVTKYDFDIEQAQTYLEASNWKDTNEDGILDRTTNELTETFQISILYNTENEIRKQIAIRLADELRGIGAEVFLDGQPYEIYVQKLQSGNFDLFVGGWQFSVVPDYSFILHSSQVGQANYMRYQNAEIDALLDAAYSSVNEADIKTAYSNLQKKAAEELPFISVAFRNSVLLSSDRVYGEVKPLESNIYDTINQWFLYEQPSS